MIGDPSTRKTASCAKNPAARSASCAARTSDRLVLNTSSSSRMAIGPLPSHTLLRLVGRDYDGPSTSAGETLPQISMSARLRLSVIEPRSEHLAEVRGEPAFGRKLDDDVL